MSAIAWKYNSNGDWDNAANWAGGVLPGIADNVTLATLSARIVTHSHGTDTINNLTATTDLLSVTGGSLSILGTATLNAGLATSGSGVLAILGAFATVAGTFTGTSGRIVLGTGSVLAMTGVTSFGGMGVYATGVEIDGAGTLTTTTASTVSETGNGSYAGLVLGSGVTWTNSATINASGYVVTGDGAGLTASLINKAGATFQLITDNAGIYNGSGYNSFGQNVAGTSTFSNGGTFAKTGGAGGVSHVYSAFTNTGLVVSHNGTLEFDGAVSNASTMQAAGGNLTFAGGGLFNGTISGGGTVTFSNGGTLGGTLTETGTVAFAGGSTTLASSLALSAANIVLDGGLVNLTTSLDFSGTGFAETAGTLNLAGNTLTLSNADLANSYAEGSGRLNLAGTTSIGGTSNSAMSFGGSLTLANTGTVNELNTIYNFYQTLAGFTITNAAGANFNVQGDYGIGQANYNSTTSTFTNAGTFTKASGTGTTGVLANFSSTGVVNAAMGLIEFDTGGTLGGSITGTGSIAFAGGTMAISAGLSDQVASLFVDGATLSLLANQNFKTSTFTETSGSVLLNGHALALNGAILSNGYLEGGTLSTTGTTVLSGYLTNGAMYLGSGITWNNTGAITQFNNVYVDYGSGSGFTFSNAAGASYGVYGDYAVGANNYNGTGSIFSNAGTFSKVAGLNTTQVDSAFTSTGIVNAATGIIEFLDGGSFSGTLSGAGTVAFGGGTSTLTAGTSLQSAGLLLEGGSLTLGSNVNYAGTYTQSSGTLHLAGNTLSLTGADIGGYYVEGAGSIVTSGTTNLAGYNGNYTVWLGSGLSLINKGTINQGYNVYVDYLSGSGFAITNQAGATYNDTGDFNIGANNSNGVGSTFSNAGTFAKTGGTGTSQVISAFTNTGLIEATTAGTIEFDGGGTLGGTLSGTGTIAFGSGSETLTSGVSLTVASLLIDNGSLTLAGPTSYAGSFTFDSGYLYLGSNTLTLTGANLGYGTIDGPGQVSLDGTTTVAGFNNQGYPFYIGGGAQLTNNGVVNQNYYLYVSYQSGSGFSVSNVAGASWNINGDYGIGGNNNGLTSSFVNAGTLTKASGTNTSQVISTVTNTGTIAATSGTLEFDGNGSLFGGTLTGAGQISFASSTQTLSHASVTVANLLLNGATLALGSNETLASTVFTQTNGTLLLSGFTFNVTGADFAYGTLEGGSLSTHGATTLANNSTVTIGGGLAWNNSGSVTQDSYLNTDNGSGAGFSISNVSAATWDLSGDFNLGSNGGVGSSFSNAGLFERTGGNNYDLVYSNFTNTGTISVAVGEIAFESGGAFGGVITGPGLTSFQNNTYNIGGLMGATNAPIQFYQSTILLTAATTIAGTLNGIGSTVQLAGQALSLGALTVTQPGSGLTFDGAGTVTTAGATSIVDWYNNGVMLDVGGGATWANTGTATISGLVQLGDGDLVAGTASGTLTNSAAGTVDLATDDASIVVGTYSDGYGNRHSSLASIVNAGMFAKTGGTGTSTIYAALTSTGTLATTSGTLALANGGSLSGQVADGSTIVLSAGVFADGALVIGGASVVTNAATIVTAGALTLGDADTAVASFDNTGTYDINANVNVASGATPGSVFTNTGFLAKIGGTGRSAIAVDVVNTGTVSAAIGTVALTGSVTGIGSLTIGAGADLELGAGVAATQAVSFAGAGGTLLLDAPANAKETITGFAVGETIDLSKLVATTAQVNASDQLVVKNGATVVATLQLAGAHAGDVYTVATDNNGGSLITVAKTTTAWTGTSADWFAANVWTNGAPGAGTDATISIAGTYTSSLGGGETASVKSLTVSGANATTVISGTLNVGTTLTVSAGSFVLDNTINGGVFANTGGGTTTFGGGLLNNVAYRGVLDLSANFNSVSVAGSTTITSTGGTGNGTINLDGYQSSLAADGYFTLDKATIDIGNNSGTSYLQAFDTNGLGGILTLGTGLSILHTGTNAEITDQNGSQDAVYNEGTITAGLASGQFLVAGNDFQNDGKITVTNGDDFRLTAGSFVNTGTLTSSAATLGIFGTLQNTGSITATNTVLNLGGPVTGAQLAAIASGGDTVNLSGSLNLGTAGLSVGPTAKITALTLTGSILNGTITAPGTAITFNAGATLNNVTYAGTIAIGTSLPVTLDGVITGAVISDPNGGAVFGSGAILNKDTYDGNLVLTPGADVGIEGTIKLFGVGGAGTGTITAAGGTTPADLYVLDTETLNNTVINSGAGGVQGLFLSAAEPVGGTLTLGTKLTFNVLANSTAGLVSLSQTTGQSLGDAIVNTGLIALGSGSTFQGSSGSIGTFTNAGHITLASGASWTTDGGTLTTESFVNTAAGAITLASGATLLTNGGGLTNAGAITLGANAVLTDHGNFTETGKIAVGTGGLLTIDGATTLADLAGVSGAGTLGIDGTLNLSNGIFDMAAAGRITNVVFGGLIENGTVLNDKGTLSFGTVATLDNIVWKGPLNIGAGSTVQAQSLTVETAAGGMPGVINLTNGAALDYLASTTVDNVTINSSSPDAGVSDPALSDAVELGASGGTLTLGSHTVLNATSGATELIDAGVPNAASTLVNNGAINVTAGALWLLDPSFGNVLNNGAITMSSDTEIGADPSASGTGNFTNAGTVTMASLDDFAVTGNAANSGLWTEAAGGEITIGGNFANSGKLTMATGTSLEANGTVTNSGTIVATGATPELISGVDGAGSSYNNGTLTGGTWQVSASSTLTIGFDTALTTDNADIVLSGKNAVLQSIGNSIARIETTLGSIGSAGTLAVLGSRGYATKLALADSGVLQLQTSTLATGGLTVTSGGKLLGSGTVAGAIANAGSITASSGTLVLSGAVTGAGVLNIAAGSVLEIGLANTETVAFLSATSRLTLDTPTGFSGTLSGFGVGDSLDLASTAVSAATLNGTSLTATLTGGGTEIFKLAASSALTTLTVTSDGAGGSILTYPTSGGHVPPASPSPSPIPQTAMNFIAAPVVGVTSAAADLADYATLVASLAHDPGGTGVGWRSLGNVQPAGHGAQPPATMLAALASDTSPAYLSASRPDHADPHTAAIFWRV